MSNNNTRKKASVVEVLEVLHAATGLDDARLDALFDARQTPDGRPVTLPVLREALKAYDLFGGARAQALSARLHANNGLVQWRSAYAGGPLVPSVRVRLDRYVDQLEIAPPEKKAANGRGYSEHHVRVVYAADRITIFTDRLATDAVDEEG